MNSTQKFLIWLIAIAAATLFWGYISTLMPKAMHQETLNQESIAAKNWRHYLGYYDYKKFTEENNGY